MSQNVRQTSHIVAEIFTDVGTAFTRLGELEMLLNPEFDSPYREKATENEVQMLRAAVKKFGEDIDKICQRIKDRTLLQIRNSMKRHAYEEAGLPLRKQQIISTPKTSISQDKTRNANAVLSQASAKSADITLNMLNATEQEVDVEGLSAVDKLDYDSADGP
ncbi:chromatin complexes subunit BAP18-like [Stegodyphus dumicola]|uniref:chromatin complexes subunit BAP18-like n=1 Tax=Stegodyphus dumicola TaxID=202533 RepID=UPI0015A77E93|nr:chromatin complexes subunit BAP18-like [Stegodyphus dumicola]XP_035228243.1 chromatin complexes subunit BAP18-like [Stegodyphus dumicola]